MTSEELLERLSEIQRMKCETATLELKAAGKELQLSCSIRSQAFQIRIPEE